MPSVPAAPTAPVIGHRGAAGLAPENTAASFRTAARLGVRWVECDAQLTADGLAVVIHDDTLDRTTDGSGPVRTATLAAIRRLDAGSWSSPAFRGEKVPTLREVLDLTAALGLSLNLELKLAERAGPAEEDALAAACLAELASGPRPPRLLVSSFRREALARCAERAPDLPRAFLAADGDAEAVRVAVALGCRALNVAAGAVDRHLVRRAHAAGLAVLAYTVDDPERFRLLRSLGVAAVFSDHPERLTTPPGPHR